MTLIKKTFQYGQHTICMQTGEVAKQATAAVMIDMDGTSVLVTVVGVKEETVGQDFFPLTVNYQERSYAAGKIPGGFFKREGRPSEKEILISRLIDRPVRPLFPDNFINEVQIVVTVLSVNPAVDSDIVSMLGASAALAISGMPFMGPIGAARIGYCNGEFLLNPSNKQLKDSDLNLVVAGTKNAVLMVESEANLLSEEIMLESVWYGHEQMQVAINAINEFALEVNTPKWQWQPKSIEQDLAAEFNTRFSAAVDQAYQIIEKAKRNLELASIKKEALEYFGANGKKFADNDIINLLENLKKHVVRTRILSGQQRIDGRDTRTVRPLNMRVGVLPRTHGSALFTRGETQALVITTLGTEKNAQIIDNLLGEEKDRFLFHYNFPPYCTGETGQVGSPKRREVGHGWLAKRAVIAVLPKEKEFPYVLRVVSEITESNGSSSMASVCGASLSLMDAGVLIKAPVAGIAMGLIKEENKFSILTDILGDEDHLGDMDFKVAGSANGITALQMDIKIDGITKFIMQKALEQAKEGRLHILKHMNTVISSARDKISEFAPTITNYKIAVDKIKDVIGKGGVTIRAITEETGATIDIADDGMLSIAAVDAKSSELALERIKQLTSDVVVGTRYKGKVIKIIDSGAFVSISPNKDGFLHISQISDERVNNIEDFIQVGQVVDVIVVEIDRIGRIRLSMKKSALENNQF